MLIQRLWLPTAISRGDIAEPATLTLTLSLSTLGQMTTTCSQAPSALMLAIIRQSRLGLPPTLRVTPALWMAMEIP
ncbi:hypothetical protein ES703_35650 [subsurface metagenome]